MNSKALAHFLVKSTKEGYASGESRLKIEEADGSTSIIVEDGSWKSHDNYFGGEPYGGRIIVFFKNKPVWMMVYYGRVAEGIQDSNPIYDLLMQALAQIPVEAPYRGPAQLTQGSWRYANVWQGTPQDYSGEEHIYSHEKLVYSGWYRGGLVNIQN